MTTDNIIKQKPKRDITLDIVRGIGITLMVIGHIGYPLNTFIYLFHMALFFIISGYLFRDKCWQTIPDVKNFIMRKIKTLYLPFIIFNILFILLHNFFININFYTADCVFEFRGVTFLPTVYYTFGKIIKSIIYTLLFFHRERLIGATWFLVVLFYVSVISCIGHYLVNKYVPKEKFNFVVTFLYAVAFIIGYILSLVNFNFYLIGDMFTAAGLFYIGILTRKYGVYFCDKYLWKVVLTCIAFITLIISSLLHIKIEISANSYPNPIFLFIISYLGFVFVYSISKLISNLKPLEKTFVFLGQSTLYLLLFNGLCFRIFSYIQITMFNYPDKLLFLPPIMAENIHQTWPFYLLCSIIGSIILMYICKLIILIFNNICKWFIRSSANE